MTRALLRLARLRYLHSRPRTPARQLQFWAHLVQSGGKLQVEGAVVFGQHLLTIGFFSHLDIGNGIATLFYVGDLGCRIFRCAVQHGDRNHGGQVVGDAAGVEEIHAGLIARIDSQIGSGVPGIDRRGMNHRLTSVRLVLDQVYKFTVRGGSPSVEFANGVSHGAARVAVTGVVVASRV